MDGVWNDKVNRLVMFKGGKEKFSVKLKEGSFSSFENYLYLDFLPSSSSTLAGEKAWVFQAPKGYCDGPECTDPFIVYAAKHKNDFYNLVLIFFK